MHNVMFAHAPDVFDEGAEPVVRNITEVAGVKTVVVGVNSYGERSHYAFGILPHNPKRRTYTNERGVVYFRPDDRYYKNLRPIPSSEYADRDVLAELSALKDQLNYNLGVWFYTLIDPRLSDSERYCAKDLFGGPLRDGICPSHPEVREYLRAQLRNILLNYPVDFIELDTLRYVPVNFESNEYLVAFMLQGCFCEHCQRLGQKLGYDVAEIQRDLKALIERRGQMPLDLLEYANRNLDGLYDNRYFLVMRHLILNCSFLQFQQMRIAIINDLHRELYPFLKELKPGVRVANYHQLTDHAWYFGQDHDFVSNLYDYLLVTCYHRDPRRIKYELNNYKFLATGKAKLLATLKLTPQRCFSAREVEDQIRAAWSVGIDGVALYDYGWMPREHLVRTGEVIRDLEARERGEPSDRAQL